MTGTIHMQTEQVRAAASLLKDKALALSDQLGALQQAASRLQSSWQGASGEQFFAELTPLTSSLRQQGAALTEMSARLEREVLEWEEAAARLDGSSTTGSAAPAVRNPSVAAMSGAAVAGAGTVAAGQVLGASTSSFAASSNYKKMSWSNKFKEEKRLNDQIKNAKKTLDGIPSEKDCLKDLERISTNEAMWRNKKAEMLREANKPGNFLVRQKYLDEAKRCDQVLNGLQKERAVVEGRLDLRHSTEVKLANLQTQKAELQQVIKQGISSSSTPAGKRNILGGCTNYVASKRDVSKFFKPGHMNATYWNENAKAAGFDVGATPVKGSIMVIEADKGMNNGVMNVSDQAGHVAYVESAKAVKGGYQVTISHAGTKYDANGNYVAGTYINKKTSTVFVPAGNQAVSFIYEKTK